MSTRTKMISEREEEVAFVGVVQKFDGRGEDIIAFFAKFKNNRDKDPRASLYRRIARKLLPLER